MFYLNFLRSLKRLAFVTSLILMPGLNFASDHLGKTSGSNAEGIKLPPSLNQHWDQLRQDEELNHCYSQMVNKDFTDEELGAFCQKFSHENPKEIIKIIDDLKKDRPSCNYKKDYIFAYFLEKNVGQIHREFSTFEIALEYAMACYINAFKLAPSGDHLKMSESIVRVLTMLYLPKLVTNNQSSLNDEDSTKKINLMKFIVNNKGYDFLDEFISENSKDCTEMFYYKGLLIQHICPFYYNQFTDFKPLRERAAVLYYLAFEQDHFLADPLLKFKKLDQVTNIYTHALTKVLVELKGKK